MDLPIGTVLGDNYRDHPVRSASAGWGRSTRRAHVTTRKRVAIKMMSKELAAHPEALARFRREVQVTTELAHPNIIEVVDFGASPTGEPYLVMEYLDGEDLEARLERDGRVPLPVAVQIIKQVASALSVAHAEGVVHRDLKPGNVFSAQSRTASVFVKVVDFGISKVLQGGDHQADDGARRGRHARVHVARAGRRPRRPDRSPQRSVGAGGARLAHAVGPAAVLEARRQRDPQPGHRRGTHAAGARVRRTDPARGREGAAARVPRRNARIDTRPSTRSRAPSRPPPRQPRRRGPRRPRRPHGTPPAARAHGIVAGVDRGRADRRGGRLDVPRGDHVRRRGGRTISRARAARNRQTIPRSLPTTARTAAARCGASGS
jgi:serine/threonine protein kinase